MTGFRRRDVVASAAGGRKSRGTVQAVLELTAEQWAARDYCWSTLYGCMRGSQPCLRSRPDSPGAWVIVMWDDRPGPYAERAADLIRIEGK